MKDTEKNPETNFLESDLSQLEEKYDIKINYASNKEARTLKIVKLALGTIGCVFLAVVLSIQLSLNTASNNLSTAVQYYPDSNVISSGEMIYDIDDIVVVFDYEKQDYHFCKHYFDYNIKREVFENIRTKDIVFTLDTINEYSESNLKIKNGKIEIKSLNDLEFSYHPITKFVNLKMEDEKYSTFKNNGRVK